jgi:hypothetical protein
MDVKNIKEALIAVLALPKVYEAAMEDGKIGFEDLALLMALFPKLQPAIEGITEIPGELKDMTEEERLELVVLVKAELDLEDDSLEEKIEIAFDILTKIAMLLKSFGILK